MQNGAAATENNREVPQKVNVEIPSDLAILFPDNYLKELKSGAWKDIRTLVFIEALFTIVKMYKQFKYPSTDELTKKM